MYRKFLQPFGQAIDNIRANIFHTFLSVLGIVIGVAALVGTLSLIDGLEKYARDQITQTTSLKAVGIETQTHKTVNKLWVKKDSFQLIEYPDFKQLVTEVGPMGKHILRSAQTKEIGIGAGKSAAVLNYASECPDKDSLLKEGRFFSPEEVEKQQAVAVVSQALAHLIDSSGATVIGRHFTANGRDISVIGVLKADEKNNEPGATIPISVLSRKELLQSPPECFMEALSVEDVVPLKDRTKAWISKRYGKAGAEDFEVMSHELRVDQAAKFFLLFRVIMGLIVGISVLVGGVGVMNVLLISVTERTPEVGLRKALGARKSDILRLFLSESITVSAFGSLLGLTFGVLGTMIVVPIVRALTDVPFQAVYTWNTFVVISVVAVVVGIVFGTWPAVKAARLDPVEAIRRE